MFSADVLATGQSLAVAHPSRPAMLPNDSAATYVLAKAPVTSSGMAVPKASPISVLAHEMIVTPATALPHTAVLCVKGRTAKQLQYAGNENPGHRAMT